MPRYLVTCIVTTVDHHYVDADTPEQAIEKVQEEGTQPSRSEVSHVSDWQVEVSGP